MSSNFVFDQKNLALLDVKDFIFGRRAFRAIEITDATKERVLRSHQHFLAILETKTPIYGVTTGFGDSSFRFISVEKSEALQQNLVAYLNCATGPALPEMASKAALLIRLNSLARGYSGVSVELLERMKLFLEKGWTPVVPREGSLGASGDLIPLAYLANAIQGKGELHAAASVIETEKVLSEHQIKPYHFKPKEALALVNGTSTMAGLALYNLNHAHFLLEMSVLFTGWMCLALKGRTDAFDVLINEKAKTYFGQTQVAKKIRAILADENYQENDQSGLLKNNLQQDNPIQDRYSIRCAPQILGPVLETIELGWQWLETEINSVSDNPLISEDGKLSNGGNFYGGYLAHSMDYLKISLAQVADLIDRQITLLMDERQNRGLTPNLADWESMKPEDRFLHHGLKGLHQSISAITSEIMAKATPNSIFSRSSESHNQDKVSLGLSAGVQCSEMIEQLFNLQGLAFICAAQALDLRKIKIRGRASAEIYQMIRSQVPFVSQDRALGKEILQWVNQLKDLSIARGETVLKL